MDKITYKKYGSSNFSDILTEAHNKMLSFNKSYQTEFNHNNLKLSVKINFKKNSFTNVISDKEHNKILQINNKKDATNFEKLFGKKEKDGYLIDGFIYWNKVYKSYNGIDLSNYNYEKEEHFRWMDDYIYDSGYLWNLSNINSFTIE